MSRKGPPPFFIFGGDFGHAFWISPPDVPGIYRPRHPESTVLYRVLFHNFDRFLTAYESRFEKEYGQFRPVVKEVVERYLDCGNPCSGFARIRCPDCRGEHLLTFSCKTRGFCPSCHAKRREEWGLQDQDGHERVDADPFPHLGEEDEGQGAGVFLQHGAAFCAYANQDGGERQTSRRGGRLDRRITVF
jgi:hypothetical protein